MLPPSVFAVFIERRKNAICEWVFPHLYNPNMPMNPAAAYRKLKTLLKHAELPAMRFHDLRHTFATHATKGGVDAKTLADISDKYLSNIECGRQNPSSDVLLRISKALQVSVNRLLPLNAEQNNRLYRSLNECSAGEQEVILKIIDEIIILVNIAKTNA